jgi:serine/threonine-protein kinase
MPLALGTRLGSFEVAAPLGTGGMGEVYRARDTKLGRDVAIKVLPEAWASDLERTARLEREAKALASLNHPHIAVLYGMEQDAGRPFLVMELVEGGTLAERIADAATLAAPLPLEETLRIARQVAEALEAAHEKGVVHRDLKPANVKITPDGTVKVLDFGLARLGAGGAGLAGKPDADALTHSPTLSAMATQAGVILGTAAYMSPEQAKGLQADHRSDVFSFGSVLYEMLTGRKPFPGETTPDVLASVVARDPDLTALPPDLHPRLHDLVRRCLEKNPKRRWQAVGDLRMEIETIAASPRAERAAIPVAPPSLRQRAIPFVLTALAAALVAGALVGGAVWSLRPRPEAPVTRFSFTLPEGEQFEATAFPLVAISPDGAQMVYAANQRLYVRSMSELTSRPIAGTETARGFTGGPFFSPDGRSVAFWSGSDPQTVTLKRIDLAGGVAIAVSRTPIAFSGSWDADGIVFGAEGTGLMRVPATGGQPELLASIDSSESVIGPQVLPGGKAVLFTLAKASPGAGGAPAADRWDKAQIVLHSLTSGVRKTLVDGGSDARYLPSGHLVYAVGGVLFAAPFDVDGEELTGAPVPVLEGVRRGVFAGVESGVAQFSVSNTGALVYVPAQAPAAAARHLVLIDQQGAVETLNLPPRPYEAPRISPDGQWVAYGINDGRDANVWVYPLAGTSSPRQLTFGGRNRFPIWTPDGQAVTFQSDREGDPAIFWQRADGTVAAERLTQPDAGEAHLPRSWSPDGKTLLVAITEGFMGSLSVFSLQDRTLTPLVAPETRVGPVDAAFSPDGRWIAYETVGSDARGLPQVFVQPFPSTGAKYLIGIGRYPVWAPDGNALYFERPQERGSQFQLHAVSVTPQPAFTFGSPVPVPSAGLQFRLGLPRQYDIVPNRQRLIGVVDATETQAAAPAAPQIQVVLNWMEELKQRVPVK